MSYVGINEDADVAATAAALLTSVQERVIANSEHTAASRLKRHGVTYFPGPTANPVLAQIDFDDFAGVTGKLSMSNPSVGTPTAVTGVDSRSIGLWVSTPTQRPLCLDIPWPISANATAIRIVLCSRVPTLNSNVATVEVLAHVWDGLGWYPTPPGMATTEQADVTGYASADTFRFAEPWRSTEAFASIDGSVTAQGARWDSFLVRMPARLKLDRTTQRDTDQTATPARIVLSILSRCEDSPDDEAAVTITAIQSPRLFSINRTSFAMPTLLRDGASHMWGVIVGTDGVRRWHLLPCVLSSNGIADVQVACWPPLDDAEPVGATVTLIRSSPIAIQSIGISEVSDA